MKLVKQKEKESELFKDTKAGSLSLRLTRYRGFIRLS